MNMLSSRPATLVELNKSMSSRIVFCVHTVGGGLGAYKILAKRLEDTAQFYGLEDPSIYANESFSSVPELAELHVETIRHVQPHGPYLLFGSCSGGPIAYEIACQLHMEDEEVERVVMFGSQLDLIAYDPTFKDPHQFLLVYLTTSLNLRTGGIDWDLLKSMDRALAYPTIVRELANRNKELQQLDLDSLSKTLESLCMTQAATSRYRAPKSSLNIDLFTHPIGERSEERQHKNWCNWSELTRGTFNEIDIEIEAGAGTGVLAEHYVGKVVECLKRIQFSKELAGDHAV